MTDLIHIQKNVLNRTGSLVAIYALVDPRNGMVRYIGQSVDPSTRLRNHSKSPHQDDLTEWLQELGGVGAFPRMEVLAWAGSDVADKIEALCVQSFGFSNLLNKKDLRLLHAPLADKQIQTKGRPMVWQGRPRESSTENARLGRALGTQSDIAQLLGVSKRTVGRAERDPDFWAAQMYSYALRYLLYLREHDAGPFDPTKAD